MDGEQRGARHAILQTGPGGEPQGTEAKREPLIERGNTAPEGEDL
jgi:hypothetical protein